MPTDQATFAELVAKTSADNRDLERGMRQAEQVVKGSADKMQRGLDKVGAQAATASGGMTQLNRSFAALGAAGTLAGSQLGAVGSGIGALAGSVESLGIAINPLYLAIAGLGLGAAAMFGVFREGKTEISETAAAFDDLATKLFEARLELAGGQGKLSAASVAELKAGRERALLFAGQGPESLAEMVEHAAKQRELRDIEADILNMKESSLAREKMLKTAFAARTRIAGEFQAAEKKHLEGLKNLEQQIAIARGADPLSFLPEGKEKELRIELRIAETKKAQLTLEENLAAIQKAKNRTLLEQVAIAAGAVKPWQLERDPKAAAYMRMLEEIRGGAAMPGAAERAGFGITTRAAAEFRFGGRRSGTETIGPQSEEAKQTEELKKQTKALEDMNNFWQRHGWDFITDVLSPSRSGLGVGAGI